MAIAKNIKASMEKSSWIRKMFEEGIALKREFGAQNVFDFTLGNPDLNPPEAFYESASRHALDKAAMVHGYMPNAGYGFAREAMARKASRDHQVECSADSIVMTVGAAGGLNVLFHALINPGEEVIVPSPYFAEYDAYAQNHSAKLVPVPSNEDFSLKISSIEDAINKNTKIILINSPHNPTGRVYSKDSIEALCELLKKRRDAGQTIYLVADEPYRELVYDGLVVPPVLTYYEESFVVSSFSKTLSLAGERIGYIAANPAMAGHSEVMNALIMCNRTLGFVNAPAFIQRVVTDVVDEMVDLNIYKSRRALMVDGLKKVGYEISPPEGTFYLFVKSPLHSDIDFVQHLKKYKILAVPGSGFGGAGYVRLVYCVSEEVIKKSLIAFEKAFNELPKEGEL